MLGNIHSYIYVNTSETFKTSKIAITTKPTTTTRSGKRAEPHISFTHVAPTLKLALLKISQSGLAEV